MNSQRIQRHARILTLAFAATTAMWVCSYLSILFMSKIGGEILFLLSAICLFQASRYTKTLKESFWVGFESALLNMLLIGTVLGYDLLGYGAGDSLWWFYGLFLTSLFIAILGGFFRVSTKRINHNQMEIDWRFRFSVVIALLVFLMLITGGLVTGLEAGLAVPDWPNSYGHNMLLYPLSEMIAVENEGVFYEHAHRLTGMYVGLASFVYLTENFIWRSSKKVRFLAFCVFLFVCVQGLLGGLRVTGFLTFSQDRNVLQPNLWLGVVHGVLAQLIFVGFVWLAALLSPSSPSRLTACNKTNLFAKILFLVMVIQLILGAIYRHMIGDDVLAAKSSHVLYSHIALAFVVLAFAILVGVRLIHTGEFLLKRLGIILHSLVSFQLLLGGVSLIIILVQKDSSPSASEVIVTTAHQANGALLLGASFMAYLWSSQLKVAS